MSRAYRRVRRWCRSATRWAARHTRSAPRSFPCSRTVSALVLAFVGVFVAAALTYWIATTLDAPIGAFAPSVALFIIVAAMGSGGWVAPTALYSFAALAYLLALAQHDLVTRRTWFHANEPRASRLAAGGVVDGRGRGGHRARSPAPRCRARAGARSSTSSTSPAPAPATCSRRPRPSSASRTSSRSDHRRSCSR